MSMTFRISRRMMVVGAAAAISHVAHAQWQEVGKLAPTDGASDDRFGWSVAVSGDTAVIGSYWDDDGGWNAGSAYVLRDVDGSWQQVAKLTASDGAPGDEFGWGVAISGDIAVISATGDDDVGEGSGAAYVFREIDGQWQEVAKLAADDAAPGAEFGWGVSISGCVAVVGAPLHRIDGVRTGAAYVFREIDGQWRQVARLATPGVSTDAYFGVGVSIRGGTVLVGAETDSSIIPFSGSAFVFREIEGQWQEVAKLVPDDARIAGRFGVSVSIHGRRAVVGAYTGTAYAFYEEAGTWRQASTLFPDESDGHGNFGFSVSLSGDTALIGAPNQEDRAGAAYIYREFDGAWQRVGRLVAGDASELASFGFSAALSGGTAVLGAQGDDAVMENMGAAYVFKGLCLADLDGDGDADPADFLLYLERFAAGDAGADLDLDEDLDSDDFFGYLDRFTEGC